MLFHKVNHGILQHKSNTSMLEATNNIIQCE